MLCPLSPSDSSGLGLAAEGFESLEDAGVLVEDSADVDARITDEEVVDSDDLIVITDAGVLMRQPVAAIRTIGRVTQGVRLVKLDDGSIISSITRVMQEAEKPEDEVLEEEKPEEN